MALYFRNSYHSNTAIESSAIRVVGNDRSSVRRTMERRNNPEPHVALSLPFLAVKAEFSSIVSLEFRGFGPDET